MSFNEFWSRYPQKVNKIGCQKKWRAKNLDDEFFKIMAWLNYQLGTDKWKRGFVPNPETVINQERWNDRENWGHQSLYDRQEQRVSSGASPSELVVWIQQNKLLTFEQYRKPWKWIQDGGQITGVDIPGDGDRPGLRVMYADMI